MASCDTDIIDLAIELIELHWSSNKVESLELAAINRLSAGPLIPIVMLSIPLISTLAYKHVVTFNVVSEFHILWWPIYVKVKSIFLLDSVDQSLPLSVLC